MDVSIIIVNYNTKELTSNCINSVFEHTQGLEFEVILVDNDSKDGSRELFEKDKRIIRSSNSNKKYSDNMVFEICEYKKKHTYKETMEKYNINSKGTLHFILNNRLCLNNV